MKFKSTFILIGIFAGLVAYLLFVENPRRDAQQRAEERQGLLLPDLETEGITALRIEGERGSVRVAKGDGGRWRVVEPWDDRADEGRVRSLLSDLEAAKFDRQVASGTEALEPYGLEAAAATIAVEGPGITVFVGSSNPSETSRYVRVGQGPVYLLPNYHLAGLLADPSELRSKEVLEALPWSSLESLDVRAADGVRLRLEKRGETWHLTAPFEAEADPEAASRMIDKLRWARVNSFWEGGAEQGLPPFDEGVSVRLAVTGSEAPTVVDFVEVDGLVWARRTGRDAVFSVGSDVLTAFSVGPDDVLRRKPALVDAWKVEKIELQRGEQRASFSRTGASWERDGAALSENTRSAVESFLETIENEVAEEVIDPAAEQGSHGLGEGAIHIRLVDSDGNEQTFALGSVGEQTYARSREGGPVYRMPASYVGAAAALLDARPERDGGPAQDAE